MTKILTLLLDQFRQKHRHDPKKVIVSPLAMAALSLRRSVAPVWSGLPVECHEFDETHIAQAADEAVCLGIDLYTAQNKCWLAACDLRAL